MSKSFGRVLFLAIFVVTCAAAYAIEPDSAEPSQSRTRIGLPVDWSFRHVLHGNALDQNFEDVAQQEPRVLYNWVLRNRRAAADEENRLRINGHTPQRFHRRPSTAKADWNFTLGQGKVRTNMFPAKYSFDAGSGALTAANCTNDYVVYALDVAGTALQPNVVRFNNIYSGTGGFCGTAPSVMSAYWVNTLDTGGVSTLNGKMLTSPALSLLGDKIAFIETVQAASGVCPGFASAHSCSIFHVLTWGTTGNNGSFSSVANTYAAIAPGVTNNAVITNLVYSSSTNTNSSPYVDFSNDRAYFGDDNGKLYRTTCVFNCAAGDTPQIDTGWPITIAAAAVRMSPPVFAGPFNKVYIGGSDGKLYMADLTKCPGANCTIAGGGLVSVTVGSANIFGGVVDGPIVDGYFGTVFAFAGDDGTGSGVLLQTNTSLNLSPAITFSMGTSAFFDIFDGAFDDAYYQNTIGATTVAGNVFVCGQQGGSGQPALYWLPFTKNAGALSTSNPPLVNTAASSRKNVPGNPGVGCTPLTEFKAGAVDRLFFSQSSLPMNKCVTGNPADGCAMMYDITTPATTIGNAPTASLVENIGTSGIIIDNASSSPQAASVYFTNEGTTKCTTGTGVGIVQAYCAIKVTQSALQ
jgi:hypothetical protein